MIRSANVTMVSNRTETATFNTDAFPLDVSLYTEGIFFLEVTAASGTNPTLDITVRTKHPDRATYYTLLTFTQMTTTGVQRKYASNLLGSTLALNCIIGGTNPSFTIALSANLKG